MLIPLAQQALKSDVVGQALRFPTKGNDAIKTFGLPKKMLVEVRRYVDLFEQNSPCDC